MPSHPVDANDSRIVDLCCRFEDVVRDSLQDAPLATGPPKKNKFKEGVDVKLAKRFTCRPVPLHYQKEANGIIDKMISKVHYGS